MTDLDPGVSAALTSLRARWGSAAPRRLGEAADGAVGEVVGALAVAPLPVAPLPAGPLPAETLPAETRLPGGVPAYVPSPIDEDRVVRTGFAALDAILGPGGVPRSAVLALRGAASSGKTTLALRLAAEAQAAGSIVAYVDLGRHLDPVEAVARGVRLEWLVVLEPASLDEALAMAGALVAGRAVDLLIVDLPDPGEHLTPDARAAPRRDGRRSPSAGDRIGRLAALARRAGVLLVVLEPPGLPDQISGAIAESAGLRLELVRHSWIRLGRDVVGQRTEVVIGRNRYGPPARRAELRILYAEGGGRDACLLREPLLSDTQASSPRTNDRATPPPLLAASSPPSHQGTPGGRPELRIVSERTARSRRSTLDGRNRS